MKSMPHKRDGDLRDTGLDGPNNQRDKSKVTIASKTA